MQVGVQQKIAELKMRRADLVHVNLVKDQVGHIFTASCSSENCTYLAINLVLYVSCNRRIMCETPSV